MGQISQRGDARTLLLSQAIFWQWRGRRCGGLACETLRVLGSRLKESNAAREVNMGEENSNPKPNSENVEKKSDAAAGDPTLDPSGTGDAAANLAGRMSIGPYLLVKILGEGGMGQVWLAEQTAPVQRQVALKLIKVGIYDDLALQHS